MKRYTIENCKNPLAKIVSVAEYRPQVENALDGLPFVDRACSKGGLKTQILVEMSALAEPSDLEEMEAIIREIVGDGESEVDDDAE